MLNEMSIEIIRKCPNNCIHCSSSSSDGCKEIIPFDIFQNVVDSAVNLRLKTLCFSGGEPFLHPDIIKMVEYVSNKKIQSYIYTSGISMNDHGERCAIPPNIISQIKHHVTKLIFNVEAASEKKYDQIMGTSNCFSLLKQSVATAVENGIICEAHFVPMKANVDEIEDTIRFCEDIGISKISFLRLVPHGRALVNEQQTLLTEDELDILKKKLFALQEDHSIRIGVPFSGNGSEVYCEAAVEKLNIKYDGYVYPCEVFKNTHINLSENSYPDNIFEKSIEEIYYESEYLNNIRQYIAGFCQYSNCENCAGQFYIKSLQQ